MSLLHWIKARHVLPIRERAIQKLEDSEVEAANSPYEFHDALRNRIILDPPIHGDATCDRCEKLHFCLTCVVIPGQGPDHDPGHRLVQVQPTVCAVCEDLERLEVKPADIADRSNSATQGLFQSNQTLSALDYRTNHDPRGDNLVYIKRPSHASLSRRASEMTQSIDQRGWTMQERLMSLRFPHSIRDEMVREFNTLTDITTRKGLYEHWRLIVRERAKQSLAYEIENMPALRGLVDEVQRAMADLVGTNDNVKDEYLAGLWRNDLLEGLAWKPLTPGDLAGFLKATNHRRILIIGVNRVANSEAWEKILAERNRLDDWHQSNRYKPTPVNANEPTSQVSSSFLTLDGHLVCGLRLRIMQAIYEGGEVKEMCFLSLAETYAVFIEFAPDDRPGLLQTWGSDLTQVVVSLSGTRDFAPEKGGYETIGGLSNPVRMSWKVPGEKENDEVSYENAALIDIPPARDLPSELVEAFVEDVKRPRFTTFMVLKESKLEKGKYERLGCFDVWGRNDVCVATALFNSSLKGIVTII
ncbi:heterokaryon incompatibility protein [Colletotrichum simmondsii]|uniref:Heterokaryon incompatibility protein n=1 Tax=Colletotrichum simmondsii TaxID=703756 RepID=A0A135U016_9PEZI|nr:heterokaryon incompatibility protein [Colletotrichum simmondsii]